MTRTEVEAMLAATIDAESLVGIHWRHGTELAQIAFRRWNSFERRNKVKRPTMDNQILDLAKGLQSHIDPTRHDPFDEYVHLAKLLAAVLGTLNFETGRDAEPEVPTDDEVK